MVFSPPGIWATASARPMLVVTVNLADVQRSANGSRVALEIGNTTAVTLNGVKANIEWGSVDQNGFPVDSTRRDWDCEVLAPLPCDGWTPAHAT